MKMPRCPLLPFLEASGLAKAGDYLNERIAAAPVHYAFGGIGTGAFWLGIAG